MEQGTDDFGSAADLGGDDGDARGQRFEMRDT